MTSNCILACPNEFHEFVGLFSSYCLFFIITLIRYSNCSFARFPPKYECFCTQYVPNNLKTKNRRSGIPVEIDESKMCPFADHYDADLHDGFQNRNEGRKSYTLYMYYFNYISYDTYCTYMHYHETSLMTLVAFICIICLYLL